MRDGNRLKEKIELRLDQRQVVSFVMVALVLAGAIFALGVMVGKNLAGLPGRVPPPSPEGLLDRLDETAKTSAAARALLDGGSDGLTFQEELTRPEKPRKAEKNPKVAKVAPTPNPTPTPTLTPTPTATATPEPPTVVVDQAPEPPPSVFLPAPPKPVPAKPPAPFFTVQIKATQSGPDADHFVAKLKGDGYHPFTTEVDIPGKGHWYRVRVGKFDSRADAEKYLGDFKRETHLQAFVTAAGN